MGMDPAAACGTPGSGEPAALLGGRTDGAAITGPADDRADGAATELVGPRDERADGMPAVLTVLADGRADGVAAELAALAGGRTDWGMLTPSVLLIGGGTDGRGLALGRGGGTDGRGLAPGRGGGTDGRARPGSGGGTDWCLPLVAAS
jgi:hypothetical protein